MSSVSTLWSYWHLLREGVRFSPDGGRVRHVVAPALQVDTETLEAVSLPQCGQQSLSCQSRAALVMARDEIMDGAWALTPTTPVANAKPQHEDDQDEHTKCRPDNRPARELIGDQHQDVLCLLFHPVEGAHDVVWYLLVFVTQY